MDHLYDPNKATTFNVKVFCIRYYCEIAEKMIDVNICNKIKNKIFEEKIILPNKDSVHYEKEDITKPSPEEKSLFFEFLTNFGKENKSIDYYVTYVYTYNNHSNVNEYINKLYIRDGNIVRPD